MTLEEKIYNIIRGIEYDDQAKAAVPEIVSLIQEEKAALLDRLVIEIEKVKYQPPLLGTPEATEQVMNAVNDALEELKSCIAKERN